MTRSTKPEDTQDTAVTPTAVHNAFVPPSRRSLLTRPLFSVAHQPHLFIKAAGKMFVRTIKGLNTQGGGDNPTVLLPCVNLETEEEGDLIVPAVLASVLTEQGSDYVGQQFELVSNPPRPGKKYRDVKVYQL